MLSTRPPTYQAELLRVLVGRELKIRYKGSLLGVLWALLSPLGTVAVLHLLFSAILPLDIPHYAAFIYSGLLPWTWFQASVQTGAATLLDNRDLVRTPFFPRVMLPAVTMSTNFMLYLLALPVLLGLMLFEGVAPTAMLLLLPVVWLVLGAFTLACTVLVAALGAIIRDIQHLLGVGMLLWFYLTPVFYDPSRIGPERRQLLMLNPMSVLVQAHRDISLGGRGPDWPGLAWVALVSVVLLAVGVTLFRALQDAFVEEV